MVSDGAKVIMPRSKSNATVEIPNSLRKELEIFAKDIHTTMAECARIAITLFVKSEDQNEKKAAMIVATRAFNEADKAQHQCDSMERKARRLKALAAVYERGTGISKGGTLILVERIPSGDILYWGTVASLNNIDDAISVKNSFIEDAKRHADPEAIFSHTSGQELITTVVIPRLEVEGDPFSPLVMGGYRQRIIPSTHPKPVTLQELGQD